MLDNNLPYCKAYFKDVCRLIIFIPFLAFKLIEVENTVVLEDQAFILHFPSVFVEKACNIIKFEGLLPLAM